MVQTERLRPASWPAATGVNFFLTGYRVFAKYRTRDGRTLRGLRILRSDTDRWLMVLAGNALTHYRYRHATVNWRMRDHQLHVRIGTPRARADVDVIANLASCPARLPAESVFLNEHDARRFAGPLPYTFDYEAATNSIIRIEGVRQHWQPQLVDVDVRRVTYFDAPSFQGQTPRLVSAFYLHDVAYRWERGIVESLAEENR
jgi:hypothetical protein